MKIWLDDIREPPDSSWIVVRSAESFQTLMSSLLIDTVKVIAFDHDLGEESKTGYDCAKYLIETTDLYPILSADFRYYIQSSNPVGRANIKQFLDRFFERSNNETVSRQILNLGSLDSK